MYEFLRFYNNKGEYTNYSYDSSLDKWTGRIDMHTISVDLIESFDLFLVEEVWNNNTGNKTWTYPHGSTGITTINASFNSKKPVPEIFVYAFTPGPTSSNIELNKLYSIDYDFDSSIDVIAGPSGAYPGIKETGLINSTSLPIHIGFMPSDEDGYTSILTLKDNTDHVIAEITIYGEGEEEDERLRTLLLNMGHDLLPEDSIIFDTSDVNEESIDWNLINRKRKELLLEYSNIFPYLGSYKALINIIKFYGYQNVHMKEYWKNVDINSTNYLKYRQIDVKSIFTENASFSDTTLVPSKIYRKTSKFGLFYDINIESGEYDSDGLPITEEVFSFTPEEILIKIYALKKKLQNYFLPVNAKIVDIIGEALYFAQYKIGIITEQNRIDSVSLGIKPKISISPGPTGYIEDLRPLYYLGFPIGHDLNIGGYTDLWSYRIEIDSSTSVDTGQKVNLKLDFEIAGNIVSYLDYDWVRDPNDGQIVYSQKEVATKISELINDSAGTYIYNPSTGASGSSYVFDNFFSYPESSSDYVRIIQKIGTNLVDNINAVFTSTSTSPHVPSGVYPNDDSSTYIDASLGGSLGASGAPMSYYADTFLGYFDKLNVPIVKLNDDEDIPLGYPIVLHNDTFDIGWKDINVTYNQLDSINPGSSGPNTGTLYSMYSTSNTITGWTSVSTPIISVVPGFPSTYFPNQNSFSWINVGYYGYYDMQWIVKGPRSFKYDSTQLSIEKIKDLSLILPYVGSYDVELYLWDLYNNRSMLFKTDFIEVKIPNSDFIGWYQKRELDYNWNTREYPKQSNYKNNNPPIGNPLRKELSWDDYGSTWDLPLHPNEDIEMLEISSNSLDSIEFYQTIYNPSDNPLVDRYPYNFNLLGDFAKWNDAYHLWWDNTGTRITQFEIPSDLATGSNTFVDLFMTRGNSIVAKTDANITYIEGPTGWTGATASGTGATGDYTYVNSGNRVYEFDGTEWKYIYETIDGIKIPLTSGTLNDDEKLKEICDYLNKIQKDSTLDPNSNHDIFNDFIYYYNEDYDTNYSLVPYIRAVSKKFDKQSRHTIYSNDSSAFKKSSYETVYFGYLGDIPTHFEIFDVPTDLTSSPSISINYISGGSSMTSPYLIGSTSLSDLVNELNGPTAQGYTGIGDFTYNLVMGASGWTGGTGPTAGMTTEVKLQGIHKSFSSEQKIGVDLGGDLKGTYYGRSLIKNPTWDSIRVLKYTEELPLLTVVNLTYDNSKMKGKKNPKWTLIKEDDNNFGNIYYNNKYFSYMFTEKGSYTIILELEDTNGNKNTVKKQEIIKII